jgi:hypothetical protein
LLRCRFLRFQGALARLVANINLFIPQGGYIPEVWIHAIVIGSIPAALVCLQCDSIRAGCETTHIIALDHQGAPSNLFRRFVLPYSNKRHLMLGALAGGLRFLLASQRLCRIARRGMAAVFPAFKFP